ncbi:MAG: lysostaphin resistance A-like protein [Woeseiaceae bacterium]
MELNDSQGRITPVHSLRARLLLGFAVVAILLILDRDHDLLSLFPFYRDLNQAYTFYVLQGGRSLLQMALVVVAVALLGRQSLRSAGRELGFSASLLRGLAFGFGAATVMFVGFALTMPFKVPSDIVALLYLAGLSPLSEEVLYRAFGVGTLRDRCGAPTWLALLIPATIFGLAHVGQGATWSENMALFALTGSGGLFFGWFYLRWQRNLWVPFFLHAGMNLSWELFDVSSNAIGGWWPFVLQTSAIVIGILATLKFAPRRAASITVEVAAQAFAADAPLRSARPNRGAGPPGST